MIVLGIDPGIAITGFAVVEEQNSGFRLCHSGLIRTPAGIPLELRLKQLFQKLEELDRGYGFREMACEKLFFSRNVKTAMSVSHARGVILLYAALHDINVTEYTPGTVKQTITGYGSADKKQMQKMAQMLLNLKQIPAVDDEADAMGIAICHLQHRRFNPCSAS